MVRPGYYYYTNLRARRAFWVVAGFLAVIALGRKWDAVSVTLQSQALLYVSDLRFRFIVFAIVVVLIFYFRSRSTRSSASFSDSRHNYYSESGVEDETIYAPYTDPTEYVLALETYRILRGFKPGWLYYCCLEADLLEEYESLQASGRIERSFKGSAGSTRRNSREGPKVDEQQRANSDPYEILGVLRSASIDEVKRAYRELIKLYHPDRVHGLGAELQDLARVKTAAINTAYEELSKRR